MKSNPLARSIVAMLILRKRVAYRCWMRYEDSPGFRNESWGQQLYMQYLEAHNAAEAARRMLYGIDD